MRLRLGGASIATTQIQAVVYTLKYDVTIRREANVAYREGDDSRESKVRPRARVNPAEPTGSDNSSNAQDQHAGEQVPEKRTEIAYDSFDNIGPLLRLALNRHAISS